MIRRPQAGQVAITFEAILLVAILVLVVVHMVHAGG